MSVRIQVSVNAASPHALALSSEVVEQPVRWRKRAPLFMLNVPEAEAVKIAASERVSRYLRHDRIGECMLLGYDFVVKGGEIVGSIVSGAGHHLRKCRSGGNGPINQNLGFEEVGTEFTVLRPRDPTHVPGNVFAAVSEEPHNWGLWLLYRLPEAVMFATNPGRYDNLMIYKAYSTMDELLAIAGVPAAAVIQHRPIMNYRFDDLTMPRYENRDRYIGSRQRAAFNAVRETVMQRATQTMGKRIYLGRRGMNVKVDNPRRLLNESELIAALEGMDFVILEPERLAACDQIAAMAGADVVVGLGGAAMFNTVFCRPGTVVVDIEATTTFLDAHTTIFASSGLDYGIILGNAHGPGGHPAWTVDVEAAVKAISSLI